MDEGAPKQLIRRLLRHQMFSVIDLGWSGIKNGHLLQLVEDAGFEVFVTCDKNMQFQQSLRGRPFAVLILSVNNFDVMEPHIGAVVEAVDDAKPGQVRPVFCGRFVPTKFRRDPSQ